jgi:hypothetical protein
MSQSMHLVEDPAVGYLDFHPTAGEQIDRFIRLFRGGAARKWSKG